MRTTESARIAGLTRLLTAVAVLVGVMASAKAQDYPTRLIKVIQGFSPGGNVDIIARVLAQEMEKSLGQTIVVEPKPGGAGSLAAETIARSDPDGYTLLVTPSAHPMYGGLAKHVRYRVVDDFTWISTATFYPFLICVRTDSRFQTLQQLIDEAHAQPGLLKYASSGFGTGLHTIVELIAHQTKTKFLHVPYRGEGQAITALLTGEVDFIAVTTGPISSRIRAGEFRALAVTGKARWREFPNVPRVAEAGVPGFEFTSWTGLAGPASRRRVTKGAIILAAGVAAPAVLRVSTAVATYPDRPVKIVVANSPGGPSDIIARLMAAALQQAIGGSFIVENKGGAGGNIGMGSVARADPDGYTLLITTSAYVVNPGLYSSLPYDPFKDFAAVAEIATTPNVFAVKPRLGVNTMKDLVAVAKANPDKFNVSTPPIGTTAQLAVELLKVREGLSKVATIVFTGGGEALKALLGDTVQLSVGALAPALPHLESRAIVALATTGMTRWFDLPEVPTMGEAGFPDFVLVTYVGLMAPAKTPPELVARLEKETLAILNRMDIRDKLAQSGFQVEAKDGRSHAARIINEVPMYREIIAKAGIKKL